MANAAWPAGLPQYVLLEGYSEKLPATKIETPMEAGRPKKRRRFTTNWRPFTLSVKLLPEQRDLFEAFYRDTLADGTLPFDWVHPYTRRAVTFSFRDPPPEYRPDGGMNVVVAFAVDQIA